MLSCSAACDDGSLPEQLAATERSQLHSVLSTHFNDFAVLKPLCPDVESVLQNCLTSDETCRSILTGSESNPDVCKQVLAVGTFMSEVGVLQSHVMAPQGPVDPVQVLSIRLQHVHNQVRHCACIVRKLALSVYTGTTCTFSDE